MGSIRNRGVLVVLGLIIAGQALHSQTAQGGNSLSIELQRLERASGNGGLSTAARRDALVRQAKLLSLSGDMEGAARAWLDAAFTDAGNWDESCLLEGARCFIALGELEKADTHIKTVLISGKDSALRNQARYLAAYVEAFRSGNGRGLSALLEDPEYADKRPAMLYTLWHFTGGEAYRGRLLAEFPTSPEARIIQGNGAGIRPTAMWLLLPGRDGLHLSSPIRALSQQPSTPPIPPVSQVLDNRARMVVLQTGLFNKEENAQVMAARLRNAGFSGAVSSRVINGMMYWSVTVPAGTDMKETILRLKNAGFESFPLF
ncbi:MAG: SPOR domain-containing protein [Treponema sp.]|nr:SPOR domain-containing protein [Treponema sp.]